jgi:hypothetical protein
VSIKDRIGWALLKQALSCVLAHTRFMEFHKLSSFDGHWVGRHPTVLHRWYWDSVRATHGLPNEVFVWKMILGYSGPDLTLWYLLRKVVTRDAFVVHVCRVARLISCKVILIWISVTPSDMGGVCLLCSNVEVLYHHVHMRFMFTFNYDYLVVKINDTKNGWLSYYTCLA